MSDDTENIAFEDWQKSMVQRYKEQYIATLHELEDNAEKFIDEICSDCDCAVEITIRIEPAAFVKYSIKREKIAKDILSPKQDEQPKKHN